MIRERLRPVYLPLVERSSALTMLMLYARRGVQRETEWVASEYDKVWADYRGWLDKADRVEDWLYIPGFDDKPHAWHIGGRVHYGAYDHLAFYIDKFVETIKTRFPNARSITEYGCGTGRNLLALKKRMPELECYGYELAPAGVEIGRDAAKKFGLDVKYAQLDYILDGEDKYVHPATDLALTVYSIEQIPEKSNVAVRHMFDHVKMGSIHLEPVCENYPLTYRGVLGRLYTRRMDMVRGLDAGIAALPAKRVHKEVLDTSQNKLMYPTLFAVEK